MTERRVQRRPCAILAADLARYSRLMQMDEEATLSAWWSYRREDQEPTVAAVGRRIVKLTGDGFQAEFSPATAAVEAALAMQTQIASRVANAQRDRRIEFGIGVNLGDTLWDDEDIYGDGVDSAA